jgi:hypothetical protein
MAQQEEQAPLQPNQESEEGVRNRAIDLFIAGKKPEAMCREVGRSRVWFYKTLARYQAQGREGLRSQSRAPKRVHNRTAVEREAAVVRVRQTILRGEDAELRYASIGADTIAGGGRFYSCNLMDQRRRWPFCASSSTSVSKV